MRAFTRVLIEVDEYKVTKMVEVFPPAQPGQGPSGKLVQTIVLHPLGLVDYFEKRQQMSIMSIFANPMMLMMMVTLGLGMLMPKLMENLDPEELKKMQKDLERNRQLTADPTEALASMLSGAAASTSSSSSAAAAQTKKPIREANKQ